MGTLKADKSQARSKTGGAVAIHRPGYQAGSDVENLEDDGRDAVRVVWHGVPQKGMLPTGKPLSY